MMRFLRPLPVVVFLISFGCSDGSTSSDATIRWRAQSGIPVNSWSYQDHFVKFAQLVKERSQGRLEIQIFAPGTVVSAYEQFSAVQKKAIEVGMGVGGYNLKRVPESYIEQGLFGAFSSLEEFVRFYTEYEDGAVYQIIDEAYREKGCHLLKSLGPSPLVFVLREPLSSVEELRGKKIRGSGAAPDLISNLGAVPVTLAPAELYLALQTGTIDGLITPQYTIGTLNLWDAAKGMMGPPIGEVAGDIYVNLEVFNNLPPDLQEIVEQAGVDAMHYYVETIQRKIGDVLEEARTEHGVTVVELPQEEFNQILKAAAPILEMASERSPRSARLIELMKQYLREKGSPLVSF